MLCVQGNLFATQERQTSQLFYTHTIYARTRVLNTIRLMLFRYDKGGFGGWIATKQYTISKFPLSFISRFIR